MSIANFIGHRGAGAPSHTAPEGTLYWDNTNNKLYINDDGSTGWTDISGGGGGGGTYVGFSVDKNGSNQSINSGSTTRLTWDGSTAPWDTEGDFDDANDEYVVGTGNDGKWLLTALVEIENLDDQKRMILYVYGGATGGTILAESRMYGSVNNGEYSKLLTFQADLAVGDELNVRVLQNNGTALNIFGSTNRTFFQGVLLEGASS